jgi:thiamine-monophosphate kinase
MRLKQAKTSFELAAIPPQWIDDTQATASILALIAPRSPTLSRKSTVEHSFLAYLRGRCRKLAQVTVGIGDDAAVMEPAIGQQIACVDQIIDGVDFLSNEHSLADVGYKSVAINLSDIAAMGGKPTSMLVTLSLPSQNATRIAGEVYEGILEAAAEFDVAIAGGDISTYDGPLAVSVTLLGSVDRDQAFLRSGAEEGDAIMVSGAVGGSLRGRHLRPVPRLDLAQRLRQAVTVTSAIDISDGLSLDLDRLCAASGVGAELNTDRIPIHEDAQLLSESSGRTQFQHAWSDGEDFELLVTMSQKDADSLATENLGVPLTQIGNIVGRTGLWQRQQGKLKRLSPQGYMHGS